jgi:predicted nucleic acid-binding protein
VLFLLDTNVISEATRPRPDTGVAAWLRSQSTTALAMSVLTLGEIRKGVDLLPDGARRRSLEAWLATELPQQFRSRMLAIDDAVALEWGRLAADGRRQGRELPAIDGLLLATAAAHGLTLVTRNLRDCEGRGVEVLNPWNT